MMRSFFAVFIDFWCYVDVYRNYRLLMNNKFLSLITWFYCFHWTPYRYAPLLKSLKKPPFLTVDIAFWPLFWPLTHLRGIARYVVCVCCIDFMFYMFIMFSIILWFLMLCWCLSCFYRFLMIYSDLSWFYDV